MNKPLKTTFLVMAGILLLGTVFASYRLWEVRTGRLIRLPNGTYLTQDEFHKIYPPQNTVLPDKNKPEEVYTKFREAIIAGNVDEALKYIAERRRDKQKESLISNLEFYKKLPDFGGLIKISQRDDLVNMEFQYLINQEKFDLVFEKTWDGYWFIYGI
jgi:hypothetical protein